MRTLLVVMLLGLGGGDFARGLRAYREGRFRDAYEVLTRAVDSAGGRASAALHYDRALAALRAGELREAELSAEKAAVRGGAEHAGLRDFLHGNAAFARCRRAEAEAGLEDPDPTAFARAMVHAHSALRAWQRAAASRDDWPEARRNAERALLALEELEEKRLRAEELQKAKQAKKPDEPPPDEEPPEDDERDPEAQEEPGELTAEQLARLLDKLGQKEKEKRALRQARRRVRNVEVERDW